MTAEERQKLANRLAEIRQQLDAISAGGETGHGTPGARNRQLYAEMVSLERRLFAGQRAS